MSFFVAINCMDGRIQIPVIQHVTDRYHVDHVDLVTEAGPVKILAEQKEYELLQSIFCRVDLSIEKHRSEGIAITAHHDCAGNPADRTAQLDQLEEACAYVRSLYPQMKVVGLWVDENWTVFDSAEC